MSVDQTAGLKEEGRDDYSFDQVPDRKTEYGLV